MFGGVQWGTTIAAIVLNCTQLFTQIHKVGFSNFKAIMTGGEGFKGFLKTMWTGIKADFSAVFGKGLNFGQRLKAIWNIVVLNQSGDFSLKNSYKEYLKSITKIRPNAKCYERINGKYVPKSDDLINYLKKRD